MHSKDDDDDDNDDNDDDKDAAIWRATLLVSRRPEIWAHDIKNQSDFWLNLYVFFLFRNRPLMCESSVRPNSLRIKIG